jgi:hypothetical protein
MKATAPICMAALSTFATPGLKAFCNDAQEDAHRDVQHCPAALRERGRHFIAHPSNAIDCT